MAEISKFSRKFRARHNLWTFSKNIFFENRWWISEIIYVLAEYGRNFEIFTEISSEAQSVNISWKIIFSKIYPDIGNNLRSWAEYGRNFENFTEISSEVQFVDYFPKIVFFQKYVPISKIICPPVEYSRNFENSPEISSATQFVNIFRKIKFSKIYSEIVCITKSRPHSLKNLAWANFYSAKFELCLDMGPDWDHDQNFHEGDASTFNATALKILSILNKIKPIFEKNVSVLVKVDPPCRLFHKFWYAFSPRKVF